MKLLTSTLIALTLSCNALATVDSTNEDDICLFVSRLVDGVVMGRDRGLSFFDSINLVKDNKEGAFKTIYLSAVKDAYDREYMSRNELTMYWYDKCVKEITAEDAKNKGEK